MSAVAQALRKSNPIVRWARKATDLGYEVAGLPSLSRRVRALLSRLQRCTLRASDEDRNPASAAGSSEFEGLEFVLGGGLLGADGHDLVGAHHTDGNEVLALGFTGFLACGMPSQ
jgi:hypothetical protein